MLTKHAPRAGKRWAAEIFTALGEQGVVVFGTRAAGMVVAQLASMLKQLRSARNELLTTIEAVVEAHALHEVLTSMPAIGVRTAARVITKVAGKEFQSSGRLASYIGLVPVTWRSGTSIRGDHSSKKGNKTLKRAFFLSAFATLKEPLSRAYYDKKRAEGKRHNLASIALARRRCDVLFAMRRDDTLYDAPALATT
ncbi:transposase, IS111A/IS1328/IS1533 [Arthrobacter sp. PAMC 25486]|nr:transposase, IS111A/IS1328/IS1533 [Arthrobacter sp. PAMC 25486]